MRKDTRPAAALSFTSAPAYIPKRAGQGGFTLVELISVIIILGILAAVITPKYFDLTTQAQNAALDATASEAVSRLSQSYSLLIVTTGNVPANLAALQGATSAHLGADVTAVSLGDYQASYAQVGTVITITLSRRAPDGTVTAITGTMHNQRSVPWPGN